MNIDTKRLAKDRAYWDKVAPEWEEKEGSRYGSLIACPDAPQEWNDSLPPVGTECEVEDVDQGWISATVIGHDDTEGVAVCKTLYGYDGYGKFRPLRTQAQREREEAIDFAARAYLSDRLESAPNLSGEQARKVVAFFYDAGMLRKQED